MTVQTIVLAILRSLGLVMAALVAVGPVLLLAFVAWPIVAFIGGAMFFSWLFDDRLGWDADPWWAAMGAAVLLTAATMPLWVWVMDRLP